MFPTRVRAIFSTHLRRQTAAPSPSSSGGRFNLSTPAGKNNAILAGGAAVTLLGATYYMGYWDTDKAKETASAVKKE
ncbi:hypothetical protein B0H17DRAFT_1333421 [Mycena rosella]|uniref:Uncharacterized protein n=1 Tax=Mycena rosella TaxID=1033263 RepID=A0AAD7GCM5_MYCRO|nr:hypothetical protein B0H17DRAFT_1333421 [Mycena rosella]